MNMWLRIWKFLDENDDVDSLTDISRQMKISYQTLVDNLIILEDVGYINVIGVRYRRKKVVKTQKWVDTRSNIQELYDASQTKRIR